ncbi:hypothetical protein Cyrtocomes_00280 [Candidatus Cyrtobacter comes]|uniref:Uncharacterized protein n=1 Tax=Candidatus Cyrtobacter comes TaxID=675776 RepID=A0ABU5L7S2_9RICK|nr:hypothetical protein [Candidatus Cyrtobacter comes]
MGSIVLTKIDMVFFINSILNCLLTNSIYYISKFKNCIWQTHIVSGFLACILIIRFLYATVIALLGGYDVV